MKPKVGIMSMQRIANYGSFLQAYALKSMLQEMGCDVEFVDYHPGETLIPAEGGTGLRRKFSKVIETFCYTAPLKEKVRFIKYKKNYAKNYYPYLGINEEKNYNPELDILVIGSDEVFNCVQSNSNVGFTPELFGEGNCAQKVITYAASFGNTTIEKLKEYHVDKNVRNWLKRIDTISVRDSNSGRIVETLIGSQPFYHLDPVLIYDYLGKCEYIPKNIPDNNYMILYGYSGRFSKEECKEIKKYARKRGLKIFCIGGVQDACDRFLDINPFYVIAYFKHAECVLTDTFHGTIMSLITQRQFVSVVRCTGYGNSEKMTDLLERFDLRNRMVNDLQEISRIMESLIDYQSVKRLIEDERNRSYNYLKEQIK